MIYFMTMRVRGSLLAIAAAVLLAAALTPSAQAISTATLTITRAGTGLGNVVATSTGNEPVDCQEFVTTCQMTLVTGVQYTLTAQALAGTFVGWQGDGCTGTGTCSVSLTGDATVTSTFNTNPARLSGVSLQKHIPKLSYTVTAGQGNTLGELELSIHGDLKLKSAKGVKLNVPTKSITLEHGTLLMLPTGTPTSARVTLSAPAIKLVNASHPHFELFERSSEAAASAGGWTTATKSRYIR
jgi:hypothetical protein